MITEIKRKTKITKKKVMKKIVKSVWVFNWFNSCGFTEIVPVVGSRWDMERFGLVAVNSPRKADALFIAGYQTPKSMKRAQQIYEQMPSPKFVFALGCCTMTGGMYWDSYNTVKRIDDYLPVFMYIPGCPPRPEAIFDAVHKVIVHVDELPDE
ncbi:MAG: NADH-quinone oxidoreductase subunit B [Candidatus Heimdallarchaeaceae archaeon]